MKHFTYLFAVILAAYGCSTTDGAAGAGGTGGAGGAAGSGGSAGVGGTGGSAGTGGAAGMGGAAGTGGGAGMGGQGGMGGSIAQCPDPTGNFGNPTIAGTGCGQLSNMANQRILTTATQCQFEMTSGAVGPPGLNGLFVLDMAGTFSNTTFQVGTGSLTGCNGTWTGATNTMSVTCGSCMITLTR